ncbi:MAG: TolC family protein, partial [Planctomycetes bacterium]|nr:TolC family protein [Planctomycetota bacterium]
ATVWSFAGQLVQPLFNLRKIDAQVDVAEARRVQAEADYVHAVQVAFAEVFDALSQRSASNATLASQHRHVEALERAERIAEVRHEAGVGTFLELLDVRRGLLAVREAQIDTAADELTATIDVYRALGGGWDPAGESDR